MDEVYGIEVDLEAAKEARNYCKDVIIGDVESFEKLPYPEGFFDVIICADILEHLRRPDQVLQRACALSARQKRIILSLYNPLSS
jgi:2-polyprenyl-3-methyl-5-hydroxy-6-metoxy-1,4-benzoquinol methylase